MMWCRSRIRSRRLDLCRCCSNGEGARQWESLGLIQRADASPRWLLRAMSNATIKITYCDKSHKQQSPKFGTRTYLTHGLLAHKAKPFRSHDIAHLADVLVVIKLFRLLRFELH